MIHYNIKEEINKLEEKDSKVYHYLYDEFGFEIGFGRSGNYKGHSHLYFHDILFSQQKIITSDNENNVISEKLIIAPAKTYIGNVVIKDFFFVKFCTMKKKVIFPEKTDEVLKVNNLFFTSKKENLDFEWYDSKLNKSFVKLDYSNNCLSLNFGNKILFKIS